MSSSDSSLIELTLGAYKEDLWLKQRLKLDEVIGKLEGALKPVGEASSRSNSPSNLTNDSLHGWIKFLQFLQSECSGESFQDDKQWGQLLNLMQISRKLNHKSVKFKDILKNRQLIEANASEIRRFNEQARLGRFIERLIETFELNLGRIHLVLINDEDRHSDNQHDLAEISRCRQSLDTTLRAAVNNLQIYLQNELVSSSFSARFDAWSKKFNLFTRITRKLCSFVDNYLALKKELAHLRPLVESLSSVETTDNTRNNAIQNNHLIESSLSTCKVAFKRVLEFEQALDQQLRASQMSQSRTAETNRKPTGQRGSGVSRASTQSETLKNDQQVVVKLSKLLKPSRPDEFTSEIFGAKLEESLVRARECGSTLNTMMANLRLEFGRFYFVNDLELLTIISLDARLALDSHRQENQRLISKLFNNSIERFLLSNQGNLNDNKRSNLRDLHIIGVQNRIGERILLTSDQEPIALVKRVNIYSLEIVRILNELMRKLQRSLSSILEMSLRDNRFSSAFDWLLPLQLFELAERIKFTRQAELALERGTLRELLTNYEAQLRMLSTNSTNNNSHDDQSANTDQSRFICDLKRSAAVSLTVHFVSTLLGLLKMNVSSLHDWHWLKLARYYLYTVDDLDKMSKHQANLNQQMPGACQVNVCLASSTFQYKFDLLPVESTQASPPAIKRLIYTETSERCFLAASQAIGRLKLGASPYGPAGSGKTETIKALGRLLGCQVIVHNCDETNDNQSLERLIWGLAHTGLWGCFDEFNRLGSGTLSSVSALLELVQVSLRSNRTTLELGDGQIKSIDPDSAIFVTMNPGDGQKYRGRRRLPANLRSLFLSIAMVRVQIDPIVREMLLVFGATAKLNTGNHIDARLAERISIQMGTWIEWTRANMCIDRCEWDLRLVMTILRRFNAAMLMAKEDSTIDCDALATQTLVESIVKEVAPRLEEGELDMLNESFKQSFVGSSDNKQIAMSAQGLQQLDEQLETRPGVILLGPSGSGKSSLWLSLVAKKNRKTNNREPIIRWFRLSPKSCNKGDLFGQFKQPDNDRASWSSSSANGNGVGRWSDGLFTRLVRDSLDQLQKLDCLEQVWLILDGPLDPDWIESLNSVLDDNQVLTLSSGERLNFVLTQDQHRTKCIKLIFETDDISDASPATISRLGLINMASGRIRDSFPIESKHTHEEKDQMVELQIYQIANLLMHPSVIRSYILEDLAKNANVDMNSVQLLEFACFEGATSGTLLELLQLALSEDEKESILLLNNLNLIRSEDKWQTRTFVELLRHVVINCSYYDSEFNLKRISSKMRILLTTTEDLSSRRHFKRLLALASKHEIVNPMPGDDTLSNQTQTRPIQFDQMVDWCNSKAIEGVDNSMVLIISVDGQHEFNGGSGLFTSLLDNLKCNSANQVDLYTFNNSINVAKSIEILTKLAERKQDLSSQGEEGRKRSPLIVLNSLQMSLMDAKLVSRMCHTLNMIRLKNQLRLESVRLRFLFLFNARLSDTKTRLTNDPNHAFWLQLATTERQSTNNSGPQLLEYTTQSKQIVRDKSSGLLVTRDFLFDKLAGLKLAGHSIDWLSTTLQAFFYVNQHLDCQLFMEMFLKMTLALKRHADAQRTLLANGLRRLADFEAAVEHIRGCRQAEEVSLAGRQLKIESLLEQISKVIENGHERNQQLNELRLRQDKKTEELARSRAQIELELEGVLPLIETSKRDINQCLKPEALNEIKTLRAPPKTIKDILDVLFVLLLEQQQQDVQLSWSEMKAYLTRYSLRDELTTKFDFQTRLANDKLLARLEQEIQARRDSFRLEQAARASEAIVPIVKWIQAAQEYGRVLTKVKPLSDRMQELEREHDELARAMEELQLEQSKLNEKIRMDQIELAELETSYKTSKRQLDEAKLDVERAQSVRANLSKPIERWQNKLERYDRLAKNEGRSAATAANGSNELYRACLMCTSMAIGAHDVTSLACQIRQWLEIEAKKQDGSQSARHSHRLNANTSSDMILVKQFIEDYLSAVLESIIEDDDDDSMLQFEFNLQTSSAKQLDHIIKLFVAKLNLHFNSEQLLHLWVEPTQSIEGLVQYLAQWQILCSRLDNLVPMRSLSSWCDWQQEARYLLESGKQKILLIEMPAQPVNGNAGSSQTLLDILDFFLCEPLAASVERRRVILFNRKLSGKKDIQQQQSTPMGQYGDETKHLLRMLTFDETAHELSQLQSDISDYLVELYEPDLGSSIRQLEIERRMHQTEVRRLETNLMKSLLAQQEISEVPRADGLGGSDALTSSKNELVRLLLELNKSSESLVVKIEEISAKLHDLQVERDKFQATSKQASNFYANHLARLKFIDSFYHLSPRGFARLFANSTLTVDSIKSTIELVMCSMRPHHRRTFEQSILSSLNGDDERDTPIDEQTLRLASRKAANLKQSLLKLIVDMSKTNHSAQSSPRTGLLPEHLAEEKRRQQQSNAFRLVIILHDAKKSSPQMELDEIFLRQQQEISQSAQTNGVECQYHKLYATTTSNYFSASGSGVPTKNERLINQLESQLNRILSSDPSSSSLNKLSAGNERATNAIAQTTDNTTNLTREVERAEMGGTRAAGKGGVRGKQLIKCICIANAHLASHWINSRLLDVITSRRSLAAAKAANVDDAKFEQLHHRKQQYQDNQEQILVILVAEYDDESAPTTTTTKTSSALASADTAPTDCQTSEEISSSDFDLNLLEEASLRFWYDELGLEFSDRFQLYRQMISLESSQTISTQAKVNQDELTNQLVLFHVVCQELTRDPDILSQADGVTGWRQRGLSFDYDLLSLALKVLHQILAGAEASGSKPGQEPLGLNHREAFCNHLESIVYGARIETENDEKLLQRLIESFLRSAESGRRKLAEYERLAGKSAKADDHQHNRHGFQYQKLAQLFRA